MGTDMVELSLRLDRSGRVSLSIQHGGEGLDELLAYLSKHINKVSRPLLEDLSGSIGSAILSDNTDGVITRSLGYEDGVLISAEDIQLSCTVRLQGSNSMILMAVEEVCRGIMVSEDAWDNTVTFSSQELFDEDAHAEDGDDIYANGDGGNDERCCYDDYFCDDDDEEDGDPPYYGDNWVNWD